MPIKISKNVVPISEKDFQLLDYEIMGISFSIHKQLGRFWNEKIYQNELAYRCRRAGYENVYTEVKLTVSYRKFVKVYFIDLLVNNAIYELKSVEKISASHHTQTINYLMLSGLNHAKIINFGAKSVESRFVSTKLVPEDRFNLHFEYNRWVNLDENSFWLKEIIESLLSDWGAFLETNLFYEAIEFFLGGRENVLKYTEIKSGNRFLGSQKMHFISPGVAFKITSITKDEKFYERNLYKFLQYSGLKAIQWINFDHNRIIFRTIF